MTATERRFIIRGIKIASKKLGGAPADIIEGHMLDEFARALEYCTAEESGDLGADVGQVQPGAAGFPQPELRMPDADPASHPTIPIIPPDRPRAGLIVVPGDPRFSIPEKPAAPRIGKDEPLGIWKDGKKIKRGSFEVKWQEAIQSLISLVNKKMPEFIKVTPHGCVAAIRIQRRNTYADIPSGIVKVEYGPDQSRSVRSSGSGKLHNQNSPDSPDAMRIERVAFVQFDVKQETVNWEESVQGIISMAEDVFKPRDKELANHTPKRSGNELSLRDAAAHVTFIQDDAGNEREVLVDSAAVATDKKYKQFLAWQALQQG